LYWQAAKYYANIFNGVSNAMKRFLDKLKTVAPKLNLLAVDHGLIWKKDISGIMAKYDFWANQRSTNKAVVVYDTMWGSTAKMARAIVSGISETGTIVKECNLRFNHRSDIMTEILEARAIILGSSVLNKGILPKVGDFLTYLKGLMPRNKIGTVFSSYGWNDVASKRLTEAMEEMKIEMVAPGISVNYVPDHNDLKKCHDLGKKIGKAIE
jgi:flavorubredoxin